MLPGLALNALLMWFAKIPIHNTARLVKTAIHSCITNLFFQISVHQCKCNKIQSINKIQPLSSSSNESSAPFDKTEHVFVIELHFKTPHFQKTFVSSPLPLPPLKNNKKKGQLNKGKTHISGAHFHLDCNRTNVLDNTNSIGHLS